MRCKREKCSVKTAGYKESKILEVADGEKEERGEMGRGKETETQDGKCA